MPSTVPSSSASLVPPPVFPKDHRSSPCVPAGAGSSSSTFSRSGGPRVSLGFCPGTSGTSGTTHDDFLNYSDNDDDDSDKEDDESPSMGKGDFTKNFQEIFDLITGYFPQSKPSVASHSDDLIPWLDVFGNTRRHSPLVFLNLYEKLSAISEEVVS